MSSALTAALSGLRVHQFYLDVVGNNLANSSTIGYHGSRVTFADVFSQSVRSGSAPTSTIGGVNPIQVGLGVQLGSVDVRDDQGVLTDTGRTFDLGIEGEGFFVLNTGNGDAYTRAGSFSVDGSHFLVDTATGDHVRGVNGNDIQLPIDTLLPAKATTSLALGGNLPAKVGGPLAEVLSTSSPFDGGTAASVAGSTSGPFALVDGDTLTVTVDGGTPRTVTFHAADFTALGGTIGAATAAQVATVMQQQLTGVSVSGATGKIDVTSNRTGDLSSVQVADGTGSPAALLGLSTALTRGVSSAATSATDLSDLADNLVNYVNGDTIQVAGTDPSGNAISGTFVYGTDGTTLGDLQTFVGNLVSGATVALDPNGNLVVTASNAGPASLTLSLTDGASNTGSTTFANHGFTVTTPGTGPDTARTSIDVFDTRGLRHAITLTLTRAASGDWNLAATTDDPNDTIVDGSVQGIRFNADGSFSSTTGTGIGDANLSFVFNGLTAAQSIVVGFGTSGKLDGVTQLGDTSSLRALSQDGYTVGDLSSMAVGSDGTITGTYSNGQQQTLAQVALAVFDNPGGLERSGNSLFVESANSGTPQLQTAAAGRAGSIRGGSLESSDVDVASEFVQMIEAQRGYQANARVIKVSDDLLNELVNLV